MNQKLTVKLFLGISIRGMGGSCRQVLTPTKPFTVTNWL